VIACVDVGVARSQFRMLVLALEHAPTHFDVEGIAKQRTQARDAPAQECLTVCNAVVAVARAVAHVGGRQSDEHKCRRATVVAGTCRDVIAVASAHVSS
jgi:hypothetical protein